LVSDRSSDAGAHDLLVVPELGTARDVGAAVLVEAGQFATARGAGGAVVDEDGSGTRLVAVCFN
jgi:hypothetical protein